MIFNQASILVAMRDGEMRFSEEASIDNSICSRSCRVYMRLYFVRKAENLKTKNVSRLLGGV